MMELRVRRLHEDAVVPARAHASDAGFDLVSVQDVELAPGARATVGTGIAIELPTGWAGLVCPRSGLAARHGIGVVNGPGVIDEGYRGEIRVVLHNSDLSESFSIRSGDRIAQLVLVPVPQVAVIEAEDLTAAERSAAGFGSTGGFAGGVG